MICPRCNATLPDGSAFCGNCGTPLTEQAAQRKYTRQPSQQEHRQQYQQHPYRQTPVRASQEPQYGTQRPAQSALRYPMDDSSYCEDAGARATCDSQLAPTSTQFPPKPQAAPLVPDQIAPPEQGMKWFKFIIYVQLFLSALVNLATAALLFTGAAYSRMDIDPAFAYASFPGLQAADMAYSAVLAACAVFAIVARTQLAGFKSKGPTLYFIFLAITLAANIAYLAALSMILGDASVDSSTMAQIATSIAMIIVNAIYFKNRKHLFVN